MIYFIAGASGSGKSANIPFLKKILDMPIYDFDDIGVPADADTTWRQESTEKWIQKYLQEHKSHPDICLLGQMVLGEILACPSAKQLGKIKFCLLDCDDLTRIQRLKSRNTYGLNQDTLNWSAWLRVHTYNPQWEPHVITNNAWSGLDFSTWAKLDNWDTLAEIKVIDTTDLDLTQTSNQLKNWIIKHD